MRLRSAYRVLAAAVCAGAATYVTVSTFALRTPSPQPVVAVPSVVTTQRADTKTVLVAARPLQFGNTLTADMLVEIEWPAGSVPPGAFHSREALLAAGGPRTVLAAIAKSEPILASKVTGPGQRGSLSAVIEDGMKAVTIRVDDVLGVAGFIQPGDRVDVLMTRNDRVPTPGGKAATGAAYNEVLLQNARVLAIDQIADRGPQAKPAKAVTIEVTTEGAQKVALGAQVGQLSLALLRAGAPGTDDHRRINIEDLGREQTPGAGPPVERAPEGTMVTVTRGTDRKTYEITDTGRYEVKLPGKVPSQPSGGPPQPEQ